MNYFIRLFLWTLHSTKVDLRYFNSVFLFLTLLWDCHHGSQWPCQSILPMDRMNRIWEWGSLMIGRRRGSNKGKGGVIAPEPSLADVTDHSSGNNLLCALGWWLYMSRRCGQGIWSWCWLCHAGRDAGWPWSVRWRHHNQKRNQIEAVLWHGIKYCHDEASGQCCRI